MVKGIDSDLDSSSDPGKFSKEHLKQTNLLRTIGTKPNPQRAVKGNVGETKDAQHVTPLSLPPISAATPASRPVAMLPRQQTFERQKSERRTNLQEFDESRYGGRGRNWQDTRHRANSETPDFQRAAANIQPVNPILGNSFSDIRTLRSNGAARKGAGSFRRLMDSTLDEYNDAAAWEYSDLPWRPPSEHSEREAQDDESTSDVLNSPAFWNELESKFNLCLSMLFRDGSDREKFFVTYTRHPNQWLRITISCDYRNAPDNSLETVIKSLHHQRDKIARIYEAIKGSLATIKFYDTVTNLKLQTIDNRLHVHVAEDLNEITEFPLLSSIKHLDFFRHRNIIVRESDVFFESHLSGFVYRVSVQSSYYIKKEISSPDTVEEFLYEINALAALRKSPGIIDLAGVVVDDSRTVIKGLLIEWAPGGSIADFIYENRGRPVSWSRRVKWARQVVAGISDIHEAGFVQGDCTISNIVLDSRDNVRIVDINRRGCPIGCEPPEFEGLIRDGQKVSMYIGVKSDLYQLGMILWAIARLIEDPERRLKPFTLDDSFPQYYRDIVYACLSKNPGDRLSARYLLERFPPTEDADVHEPIRPPSPMSAADLEDLREHERAHSNHPWPNNPAGSVSSFPRDTGFVPGEMDQEMLLAGMDRLSESSTRPPVLELPPHVDLLPGAPLTDDRSSPLEPRTEKLAESAGPHDLPVNTDAPSASQPVGSTQRIKVDPQAEEDDARIFARPIHQDSGLPIEPGESRDILADIDAMYPHRQQQMLHYGAQQSQSQDADDAIFGHPIHQDSGFNETLLDQSSSLAVKPSLSTHSEKQLEED